MVTAVPASPSSQLCAAGTSLKSLPAVVNDRFFILDYNEGISGPRNIGGLEKFAKYLRAVRP
ncbi:hypothetical protein AB0H63_23445 [Micromonospora echinospora]|uniref:hypothetical protein n=1 Tax=Micromonospora echinospora TaxID=1877 RepID=UPI0033C8D376